MDENLFQLVTVGLLGVTLLVLLVTLLTLNKLAKRIEEGSPSRAETPYQDEDRLAEPPGLVAVAPHDREASPSPAETSTFPATAVTAQEHAAHEHEQQASSATARAEEPQAVHVENEPAPAEEPQQSVTAEASVQEPQPTLAGIGFEDAPEEQPFERDGRWWFKRGDELLVYDEQSGQWETAPANTAVSKPATPLVPGADSGSGRSSTATAGGQAEPDQSSEDPGSFWKCTSCGAVNGSTATSCRMCFAPKP
jgi:hypothetical protein